MGRIDHADPSPENGCQGDAPVKPCPAVIDPSSPQGQSGAKAPHAVTVIPSSIMQGLGWADGEGNLSPGGAPRQRVL